MPFPSLAPADTNELAVPLCSLGKYSVIRANVRGPMAEIMKACSARMAMSDSYESVKSITANVSDVKISVAESRYFLLIVSVSLPAIMPPIAFGIV